MSVFFGTYKVRPTRHAAEFNDIGGAMVACWVRGDTAQEAAARPLAAFEDYRWEVVAVEDDWIAITVERCPADARKYFERAEVDGEYYLYHKWKKPTG